MKEKPYVSDDFQIGPDGAFEYIDYNEQEKKYVLTFYKESTKKSYFQLWYIIPCLSFCIDKQMLEKYQFKEKQIGGIISYSIYFNWLFFQFSIELNVKK